ncbi:cytochrome c-type biogenesis protein [uncultured Algimonas sp.]|uniref:cytochrome c-type biogenesis protein n=1 Tax=uncultured Algimonas sp. TaxID=1547920 RepID=UPI00262C7622|nr:cytochrome c-type biogenesis protein [uncultured Algimonas sp.]
MRPAGNIALIAILLGSLASPACAQATAPVFPPEIEERAREVGAQLRCVVCQNESIEASNADLAADMRLVVRERLAAGDTKAEVIARMRDRYGDYVLLKPPVQANTLILWAGPVVLLAIFLSWWIFSLQRRSRKLSVATLSDEERARLERLRQSQS